MFGGRVGTEGSHLENRHRKYVFITFQYRFGGCRAGDVEFRGEGKRDGKNVGESER